MMWLSEEERWALVLSTFAGLSTTIGAIIAVWRRPDDKSLAFLLGTAIGVMFTLSFLELWLHNATENGWPPVTTAVLSGALLYQVAQPFLPDFEPAVDNPGTSNSNPATVAEADAAEATSAAAPRRRASQAGRPTSRLRSSELLRLGMLMAFTMTLHNLPEGFAVAFSAFTDFGPIMATAIAVHNIPEGIIVAAPVYAATGSRWKALLVATLSGLSEPFGAALALASARPLPFMTEERLPLVLAFVGGIMGAVCVLELWPEGRKCKADGRLLAGVVVGAVVMASTLVVGV
jgi:zinc transporter, ZIP family